MTVATRPDGRARPMVLGGTVLVLVLVWAAAIDIRSIHSVPGVPLDTAWAATIDAVRTPPMIAVANVFAWLGATPGALLVTAVTALLLWWRRGRRTAAAFLVIALLSASNVNLMKAVDLRPRPNGDLWGGIGSFPSGHTAFAAVIAATLGMLFHRAAVWVGGLLFVVAMALSRTVIDAHWLTDTLAGGACGAALAVLVWSLLLRRRLLRLADARPFAAHE